MTDNMKNLLELASSDEQLSARLEEICAMEGDAANIELKKLASEQGITLTDDDLGGRKPKSAELSDDELEAVSGGGVCVCTAIGGGRKDKGSKDKGCGCVAVGIGEGKGGIRCSCAAVGVGD